MNKLMIAAVLAALATPLWAVQGTIRTEADTKTGEIKYLPRAKSYQISVKMKGGRTVDMEFPLKDVVELDIAKPQGFDRAVELVRQGQGASAVSTLKKISSEYRMLMWDKPAARYLVEAYVSAGSVQEAFDTAKGIIADDKDASWKGDLAPAYWLCLMKLGKTQELESLLKKAATSGDRPASAAALVMRGDMIVNDGESNENYRKALTDAYLRVALMYADEACKEVRADAMRKAATCFDKIGHAARAEKLRGEASRL